MSANSPTCTKRNLVVTKRTTLLHRNLAFRKHTILSVCINRTLSFTDCFYLTALCYSRPLRVIRLIGYFAVLAHFFAAVLQGGFQLYGLTLLQRRFLLVQLDGFRVALLTATGSNMNGF